MKLFSIEEFNAKRRTDQDDAATRLMPYVEKAFGSGTYDDLMAEVDTIYLELLREDSGDPKASGELPVEAIQEVLSKADSDSNSDATALWLASVAINQSAIDAAGMDSEALVLVWTTMHDDDVRHSHKITNGQQRPPGEAFDVEGVEMLMPGDPTAPIALWINCRCTLRPDHLDSAQTKALTAAGDNHDALVIVAIPAESDDIHSLGEESKHVTLMYGTAENLDDVKAAAQLLAEEAEPFTAAVSGQGQLGPDRAKVLFIESPAIQALRDLLVSDATLDMSADAHPHYVPHVTIDYSDTMPEGADTISEIAFDRLGVWQGDSQDEYPLGETMSTQTPEKTEDDTEEIDDIELGGEGTAEDSVPWYGVLVPEGVSSGDGRTFELDSLTHRDLPLPLTYQKASAEGHDGSVVVAMIHSIERIDNLLWGSGTFRQSPEADEVIGLIADFGKFGVSIDADSAEMSMDEEGDGTVFSKARICSASIVAIPAFAEAFIAIGTKPLEDAEAETEASLLTAAVSDKDWDGSASRFTPEQWYSSTIVHLSEDKENKSDHKLPIKEPNGDLSRSAVHSAAGYIGDTDAPPEQISKAKAALRGAYKTLGEDPPDSLTSSSLIEAGVTSNPTTRDGPGWLTNPADTQRLRRYWTKGPGALKIAWGVPDDFYRCKAQLGKYVDPIFLNGTCANLHKVALGVWPGQEHLASESLEFTGAAEALSLVASSTAAEASWFKNPNLQELSPLTVTEEGRVFGHIAGWKTCHTGFDGVCITPPHSATGYAYFLTGEVLTNEGPVPVGNLTMGGGHAAGNLKWRPAAAHYDSTSAAACDVAIGDDEFGIWVAGSVRPSLSEEQIGELRASSISGDWRKIGGEMELVAALAVNSPGFPVPRVKVAASHGEQISLVAAGVVPRNEEQANDDNLPERVAMAIEDRAKRRETMKGLITRVRREGGN